MKALFVVGTDTGVGKSVICGLLAKYLAQKKVRVVTQKWIETGSRRVSRDIKCHLDFMGDSRKGYKAHLEEMNPYLFKDPLSPHKASQLSCRRINPDKIIKSFQHLCRNFDFVVVEGAGGALVPYNRRKLIIDIARKLRLPVLVVARNKLGAVNHTLLTLEALKRRGLDIVGVIFNNAPGEKKVIMRDNPRIISSLSKQRVLGVLPYKNRISSLYQYFVPIGKKICKILG